MRVQAGNFYLNARGEIIKIQFESQNDNTVYRYWDNSHKSYNINGNYMADNNESDLLMEIPADKLKQFIETILKGE